MTLNLILADTDSIHVAADFRLTNADTGQIVTERSPKLLLVREQNWEAAITYCGVGKWLGRETNDWLKEWVQHDPIATPTLEDLAATIERNGNSWLGEINRRGRYKGPHSFVVAGIVDSKSKIALISNYDRLHEKPYTRIQDKLSVETISGTKRLLVTGMAAAVPKNERRQLVANLRADKDSSQIQINMGSTIALAAKASVSHGTISSSSFSYSILRGGNGLGRLNGEVQGQLEIITIHNGVDVLAAIRHLLGPNAQMIPTAHATADHNKPPKIERCEPTAVEFNNTASSDTITQISELHDLGSRHARAQAINSSGMIVGQSGYKAHGPQTVCLWNNDGAPHVIFDKHLSAWASDVNDRGEIAGTLHTKDGTRAFLVSNGTLVVADTLGGIHSNGHALNIHGDVVGGSWSLPGNTPGDKRERAFRWRRGGPMEDLGAAAPDWCSRASDINDNGWIIGISFRSALGGPSYGFVWTPDDGMSVIEGLDGNSTAPTSINNCGQVVGISSRNGRTVSFLWTKQKGTQISPLPAGGIAQAINDQGDIAYNKATADGNRSFLWSKNREIALPGYRNHQSEVLALNENGSLVGISWRADHSHAVRWAIS